VCKCSDDIYYTSWPSYMRYKYICVCVCVCKCSDDIYYTSWPSYMRYKYIYVCVCVCVSVLMTFIIPAGLVT